MDERILVAGKPKSGRCSRCVLITLLAVAVIIVVLGYIANSRRHRLISVTLPMSDSHQGDGVSDEMNTASKRPGLTDKLSLPSLTTYGPDYSLSNVSRLNSSTPSPNPSKPVPFLERVLEHLFEDDGYLVENKAEEQVYDESRFPTNRILQVNKDDIPDQPDKKVTEHEAVPVEYSKNGVPQLNTYDMHSQETVTDKSAENMNQYGDITAGESVTSAMDVVTNGLSPYYDTPPDCTTYPSSYIKDIIFHELHRGENSERKMILDFKQALSSNSELGVIDIGSKSAIYGLLAASMGRIALVLEPNHNCVAILTKIIELNDLRQFISILEATIMDRQGFGRFMVRQDSYVAVPMADSDVTSELLGNHAVFNIVTLDDIIHSVQPHRAILKINVNYFQPSVFNTAHKFFRKVKIHYIFMNWKYDKDNEDSLMKTITFLSDMDFEPREHLKKGFRLLVAFYQHWPEQVIWVNKNLW